MAYQNPYQQNPYEAPPTPEEESSFLSPIMSALSTVGYVLDLPGSFVRDALVGENPVDQFLTPTTDENRVMEREFGQRIGLFDKSHDWYDPIQEIGLGIATDPLTVLAGPATKGVAKAGKVGKEIETAEQGVKYIEKVLDKADDAAAAITPAGRGKEFAEGSRTLLRAKVPFLDAEIPLVKGGKTAQKIGDTLLYGGNQKLWERTISSPFRAFRALFSSTAGGHFSGVAAKASDSAAEATHKLTAAAKDISYAFGKTFDKSLEEIASVAAHQADLGDLDAMQRANNMLRFIGENFDEAARKSDNFLNELREPARIILGKSGNLTDEELNLVADSAQMVSQLVVLKDAVRDRLGKYVNIATLDDMFSQHLPRRGIQHSASYKMWKERKGPLRNNPGGSISINRITTDDAISGQKLKFGSKDAEIAYRTQLVKKYEEAVQDLGIPPERLDPDSLRRAEQLKSYISTPDAMSTEAMQAFYMADIHIRPFVSAQADDAAEEMKRWLPKEVLDEERRVSYEVPESAKALLGVAHKADADVQKYGLFGNALIDDVRSYVETGMSRIADTEGIAQLIKMPGVLTQHEEGITRKLGDVLNEFRFSDKFARDVFGAGFREMLEKGVQQQAYNYIAATKQAWQPKFQNEVMDMWDKVTGFYKSYLTLPSLAFHIRNRASSLWQQVTDGRASAIEIVRGRTRAQKYMFNRKADEKFLQHMQEAFDNKVLDGARNVDFNPRWELPHEAPKGAFGGAFAALGKPFRGEQPLGEAFNPGNLKRMRTVEARDAKRFGFKIKGNQVVDKDSNILINFGEKMYESTEFVNRVGYFDALRRKGFSASAAGDAVRRSDFDYSALSDFEKNVVRKLVPFWAWTRNSLPYTMMKLAERPGGMVAQTIRGLRVAQDSNETYTPSFQKEKVGLPVAISKEGVTTLTNLGLPLDDINRIIMKNGSVDAMRTAERLLADTHPLIKWGMESMFGKQLYTGRDLKYVKKSSEATGIKEMLPYGMGDFLAKYTDPVLPHSPFSRFASMFAQARRGVKAGIEGDPTLAGLQALNLATGLRFSTYDPEMYRAQDIATAMKESLRDRPEVREGTFQYIAPQFRMPEPDPELVEQMRRTRGLQAYSSMLREQQRLGLS